MWKKVNVIYCHLYVFFNILKIQKWTSRTSILRVIIWENIRGVSLGKEIIFKLCMQYSIFI